MKNGFLHSFSAFSYFIAWIVLVFLHRDSITTELIKAIAKLKPENHLLLLTAFFAYDRRINK